MAEGLVGRTEMPGFNILGLLLGGRGYAQNYFNQKDALALEASQRQERGDFATNLLQSPEYKAAVPEADRQAEYGLWARQSYGPNDIAATGNSVLVNRLSAFDQRRQAEADQKFRLIAQQQQADLQRGNLEFGHKLNLTEQTHSTDEQIRFQEWSNSEKLRISQESNAALLGGLDGQVKKNTAYDLAAEQYGLPKRTLDQDVAEYKGEMRFVPSVGSEGHAKMMKELQSSQLLGGSVDELSDMMDHGKMDYGRASVLIETAKLAIKEGKELGSLDAGSMEVMNKMISEYGQYSGYGVNTDQWKIAREKLRVLGEQNKRSVEQWGDRWGTDPAAQPNREYRRREIPPAPAGSAALPAPVEHQPASRAGGRPGTGGAGGIPALDVKPTKPFRTRGGG